MNPATEKQINYIKTICRVLDLEVPESPTRQEAFFFIQDHIDDYKAYLHKSAVLRIHEKERRQERTREITRQYYDENHFAGPYGSDIVDCFDYGIYPWGNS